MVDRDADRAEQGRCKARVKARLLRRPELRPRLGRFELVKLLGRGSTAMVYEARDTRHGTNVALKLLSRGDARAIARFECEFRALGELAHENLVRRHDLYAHEDVRFFTMDLVRGVPFTEYAHQPRSAHDKFERVRSALRQLLDVVQAMHVAGRLHCDLKPLNVLVTHSGRVVVVDLGLVTAMPAPHGSVPVHVASSVRGTLAFMAPELFTGAAPSPRSDAYAVGVMLAQALRAGDSLDPATPGDLAAVCCGLLATEPALRMSIRRACALLESSAPVST